MFKFEVAPEFSQAVWEKIFNGEYYHVTILDLNDPYKKEIQKLKEFTDQLIGKEFNRKTFCNQIKKTDCGYLVSRYCSKGRRTCKSKWSVNVNILRKEATVTFNKICEQSLSSISLISSN